MHEALLFLLGIIVWIIYRGYFEPVLRSDEFKASVDVYTYGIASIGLFIIYRFVKDKFKLY
jgi:hypothetical protein